MLRGYILAPAITGADKISHKSDATRAICVKKKNSQNCGDPHPPTKLIDLIRYVWQGGTERALPVGQLRCRLSRNEPVICREPRDILLFGR